MCFPPGCSAEVTVAVPHLVSITSLGSVEQINLVWMVARRPLEKKFTAIRFLCLKTKLNKTYQSRSEVAQLVEHPSKDPEAVQLY